MFSIRRATNKDDFTNVREFINSNHSYMEYKDRPSRKLYWLLYEDEKLVGVFGLGSAFIRSPHIRKFLDSNKIAFNEFGNNYIFCLNGTTDRNAGTRLLKLIRGDAKIWWKERYGDELKAIQTFVLPPRTGAVYKADNWIYLGETQGTASQAIRTIRKQNLDLYKDKAIETRIFKSGEVKYFYREFIPVEKKLIFVRIL